MAGIKETFSKGITTINVKTSTMLEQNKINTHISTLEGEIEALKNKAGHILWEKWNDGIFQMSDVEDLLVSVNQKLAEIEVQKKRAEEILEEEQKILGTQTAEISAQKAEAPITEDTLFCSNCGARFTAQFKFCTKCGTALGK